MAYQTGGATGVNDLLDQLRAFLLTRGWAVNGFSTLGAGKRLHVQYGTDIFFNFRSYAGDAREGNPNQIGTTATAQGIGCNGSTGYDGAAAWYAQPGAPFSSSRYQGAAIWGLAGAITAYHFFAFEGTGFAACYVLIETAAGSFDWLGFGKVESTGTITGGQFMFAKQQLSDSNTTGGVVLPLATCNQWGGSRGNSFAGLYLAVDGLTNWKLNNEAYAGTGQHAHTDEQTRFAYSYCAPSEFNELSPLQPIRFLVTRDGANYGTHTPRTPVGYLPKIFYLNIADLQPGALTVVGGTNYRVFSYWQKSGGDPGSSNVAGYHGFAIEAP
jgi:hypothetical protein